MEVEIVVAELMKLFRVESITPSQYVAAVQILFELDIPIQTNKNGELKNDNKSKKEKRPSC